MAISAEAAVYAGDKLDCDIVMKGGITSGVVYPGAIAELARAYRFRAIGGTSAGAIAAAILAAAEHRRQRLGDPEGFLAVAGLPASLGDKEGTSELRLLRLFQPDPGTRGLFAVLKNVIKHGPWLGLALIWAALWLAPAAGLALAAIFVLLAHFDWIGAVAMWIGIGVGAATAVLGPPLWLVVGVLRLPRNHFGLCTLGPRSVGSGPALTEWLHAQIQTTAGRAVEGPVLTFADLWGIDPAVTDVDARIELMLAPSAEPMLREIDLQMMTTDLTHGRPRRLPSGYHAGTGAQRHLDEGGGLVFEAAVLRRYFPERVVQHLIACGKPISDDDRPHLPGGGAGFHRFPMGPDLPVLVATRMSLSFPGLIAAVPLWELVRRPGGAPPRAQRVLFSDGGITSNFPVHFFDAPLPRRPTFGLNLTALAPDRKVPVGPGAQAAAVGPLPQLSGEAPEDPRAIGSLGQFLASIKDAMQNWRDNLQARQPGFRDRMVPIALAKDEGGMKLTMSAGKIADLSARGGEAAKLLVARFAADGPADAHSGWNDHRFMRLRITLAATEELMRGIDRGYRSPPEPLPGIGARTLAATMPYPERVAAATGPPYRMSADQRAAAAVVAAAYRGTLGAVGEGPSLSDGAPRPRTVLRVVPPT